MKGQKNSRHGLNQSNIKSCRKCKNHKHCKECRSKQPGDNPFPTTTFHGFPNLPPEIREAIWTLALRRPCIWEVDASLTLKPVGKAPYHVGNSCTEARFWMRKLYGQPVGHELHPTLHERHRWIDFDNTLLRLSYCGNKITWPLSPARDSPPGLTPAEATRVRHVAALYYQCCRGLAGVAFVNLRKGGQKNIKFVARDSEALTMNMLALSMEGMDVFAHEQVRGANNRRAVSSAHTFDYLVVDQVESGMMWSAKDAATACGYEHPVWYLFWGKRPLSRLFESSIEQKRADRKRR
ncbi:uncharacterized protein UV8b_05919 [Ustilaginoidea virens]|uniref:2EXR domain-containing protein n=1 Tax=Ustilaginoidea virens TaxID=1159556 RepID=A0A063BVC1_USTVR|nr:uncharacterized protein UV8b_05919 [Ustilaginoidea virens]QUC21676.1 hypothetical protein UV8b_05919 [Ustilaginoidea virens]GAO18807.1 hypothetical protein UVI_02015020 [Ustilaginoidea virens]